MRIDAHQHFWHHRPERDTWITEEMAVIRHDFLPEDLGRELRTAGIDGCVAVQADPSMDETRFLLELAHAHPFVRGVVGWVDLLAPDLDSTLAELSADDRLVGVRHVAQAEADDWLAREDVSDGIAQLGPAGLTYDILVYHHQLPAALTLVDRHPTQPFVVDHLAKPPIREGGMDPWAERMRELARRPHVTCKLSGMVTEADWDAWMPAQLHPYMDVVFEAFGPDPLMFGSDWPVCLLAASYQEVAAVATEYVAALSETERAEVLGGTSARFYGLAA